MIPRVMMLIPSRGRPRQAIEAAISAIENAALATTSVRVLVDGHGWGSEVGLRYDAEWRAMIRLHSNPSRITMSYNGEHLGLVGTLNSATSPEALNPELVADHSPECAQGQCGVVSHIGFMGDDHRVRTHSWDGLLATAAGPWGVAYGDDGIQGEALPTAVVMSADIVRVLGRMAPPTLHHMYIDNYWRELGIGLGQLTYMPNVEIEHLHHSVGKSAVDGTYLATNNAELYASDRVAWERYTPHGVADDVEKIVHYRDRHARASEMWKQLSGVEISTVGPVDEWWKP